MLAMYRRHPGVAALTLGRVAVTPSMLPIGERMAAELRAAGMPDQVTAFVGDLGGLYVGAYAYELDVTPLAGQRERVPGPVHLLDQVAARGPLPQHGRARRRWPSPGAPRTGSSGAWTSSSGGWRPT